MNLRNNQTIWPDYSMVSIILTAMLFSSYSVSVVFGSSSSNRASSIVIVGSEFYQGGVFDDGIVRVFFHNVGQLPVGVENCELEEVTIPASLSRAQQKSSPIKTLFFCFDPDKILPGQTGELLIKPNRRPLSECPLRCSITTSDGQRISTDIATQQPELQIVHVAFEEFLSKIYVYVRNNSDRLMRVRLEQVNDYTFAHQESAINVELQSVADECLTFSPESPIKRGQYVYIRVSGQSANSMVSANALVRAFGQFPLSWTSGSKVNSLLGLDSVGACSGPVAEASCIHGLDCISHEHGTIPEAANKFTRIRQDLISKYPDKLVNIRFCWARAYLRDFVPYFQLPDLPIINTCKYSYTDKSTTPLDYRTSFHPFYWRARQALYMSSPQRFAAVIPVGPNAKEKGFDESHPSTDYIRFMTYCSIAGGAKGIYYMMTSQEIEDPICRQEFIRLNSELRLLKPLLIISYPMGCAKTNSPDVSATILQCGDERLLVILLNKAHPGIPVAITSDLELPKEDNRLVGIKLHIPAGFVVKNVQNFYKPILSSQWSLGNSELIISKYKMTDSATALRIELEGT